MKGLSKYPTMEIKSGIIKIKNRKNFSGTPSPSAGENARGTEGTFDDCHENDSGHMFCPYYPKETLLIEDVVHETI